MRPVSLATPQGVHNGSALSNRSWIESSWLIRGYNNSRVQGRVIKRIKIVVHYWPLFDRRYEEYVKMRRVNLAQPTHTTRYPNLVLK